MTAAHVSLKSEEKQRNKTRRKTVQAESAKREKDEEEKKTTREKERKDWLDAGVVRCRYPLYVESSSSLQVYVQLDLVQQQGGLSVKTKEKG